MEIINGGKSVSIAGSKIGEIVLIHLLTGKIEKVILNDVIRVGIEGFNLELKTQPLTFYPFNTIVKIVKYIESGS